jgi:8-amino-3,8-dideoxy-alpha-D-manno-octulosonate transaminase
MPGWELIGNEEKEALNEIFDESNGVMFAHGFGHLRNGRYRVREFEQKLANYFEVGNVLATTSGTMAQYIAMRAMGIGPGDEVITQAFTFVATVETILEIGAIPVVVDVDDSYNMDPVALESAITENTKLIIPVHMLGNPCDMDSICSIAKRHNIPVMEDACEAFGGKYNGQWVGGLADVSIFSFDFAKTITTGEGGAIFTDDSNLDQAMRAFHDHGHENNPSLPRGLDSRTRYGLNLRMNEMQAAVGIAQLEKLEKIRKLNTSNRDAFIDEMGDLVDGLVMRRLNSPDELADTIIFQITCHVKRQEVISYLGECGLGTKNLPDAIDWHFAGTWHHMFDGSANNSDYENKWSKTENLLRSSVSIPILCLNDPRKYTAAAKKIKEIIGK